MVAAAARGYTFGAEGRCDIPRPSDWTFERVALERAGALFRAHDAVRSMPHVAHVNMVRLNFTLRVFGAASVTRAGDTSLMLTDGAIDLMAAEVRACGVDVSARTGTVTAVPFDG
jgi:kynureninase